MARSPESDSSSAVGAVAKASTTPGGVIGGVLRELRADLRPRRLVTCLLVGVVCGVVGLVYAISAAAFIFSGPLAPYMVAGVGMLLFATITLSLITALGSSQAGIVGTTQDVALVSFAVIAAAIEADLTERDAAAQVLPTVVAAIGLSTLLCGLVFYLLGRFRLSRFVRFVPYPVIAGFLAGTGWLIIEGAFGVITGSDLSFEALPSFAEGSALAKIATAVVLAALLWAIGRYGRNAVVLPLVIVGAMA
ncbi:MAG TPA: SulP family inorganic anion transporter, partial [Kiloniellaceae bacterium]|nr:SulP family inorganic anion transporter [Kiloniellaceae bacterium]